MFEIVALPKEKYKGLVLPMGYTSQEYYDVSKVESPEGFLIRMEKKKCNSPITHTPEEYDFPDKLYEPYWENAYAWGVLYNGEPVAAMETDPEIWSNRLRITELWVAKEFQRKGIGHALMEVAKEQARRERRRAVILETQSCNVNAVDFYRHEGFSLIGFDTCCYHNNDIERKEVRLEMGYFLPIKKKLNPDEITIRLEEEKDYRKTERMTQLAFWNKHHLGCDEHYLVHILRDSEDYLPEISRVAVKDGEVIGCIMYSKAEIRNSSGTYPVITFGPLCVAPEYQGTGVGEMLLKETMDLARKEGLPGIVIFGEPDYYPRFGFQTCDHFGITTANGENFSSFMGYELRKNGLSAHPGKFYESHVFEDLPKEKVEAFNSQFPPLCKQRFPGQWD